MATINLYELVNYRSLLRSTYVPVTKGLDRLVTHSFGILYDQNEGKRGTHTENFVGMAMPTTRQQLCQNIVMTHTCFVTKNLGSEVLVICGGPFYPVIPRYFFSKLLP